MLGSDRSAALINGEGTQTSEPRYRPEWIRRGKQYGGIWCGSTGRGGACRPEFVGGARAAGKRRFAVVEGAKTL